MLAVCSEAPEDAVAVSTRAAEASGADGDGVPPRAGEAYETDETGDTRRDRRGRGDRGDRERRA
ncbi:hypothetical protein SGLAM104S_07406 [Streptomyces glaucescens]